MDLSGNTELLDKDLVAFFASRTSPPEALDLARQWAHEIAETDKVVISGFHSPIERAVLNMLSNAAAVSKPGSTLTVSLKNTDKTVLITLRDTGPGIPQDGFLYNTDICKKN